MERCPEIQLTQEIRFAIVMYGGISLAIYMNGIAQELRKMVRATAPRENDGGHAALADGDLGPNDTEFVYRKLGRMLSWGAAAKEPGDVADKPDEPIRTRFVVDVLSGSSAGGINAVYLAKSLANDQPMEELKKLWIEEGDIGVLINDKASVKGTDLDPQVPPRSLLNGARMYWKLLDALCGMDSANGEKGHPRARNAEELDLYVTATDIGGQAVSLQLADRLVDEYRHRNVFHFRYDGDAHNDFLAEDNPFLAFAARCTSAHPAAFEPMRLEDVDEVLNVHPSYAEKLNVRADYPGWQRYFKEYLRPGAGDADRQAKRFLERDFNDGGVLDNRPFGYATDAMPLHRAEVPVSRKLVYLDPAPEHIRKGFKKRGRPNIATNVWLSLSTLPRYEPIREDLRRVLERNRLIERVNAIVEGMERRDFRYDQDVAPTERMASVDRQARYTNEDWDNTKMSDMIRVRGLAWAGYQHLRVTEVTDDLSLLLTRVAGRDDDSDDFRGVRQLVRLWRERRYDPEGKEGKLTEHAFLRAFDVKWRLRRLRFVLRRIDQMLGSPQRARELVEQATPFDPGDTVRSEEFRQELLVIRTNLDDGRTHLRKSTERLWAAREDHPLREAVSAIDIQAIDLEDMLDPHTAQKIVEEKEQHFDYFRDCVGTQVDKILDAASQKYEDVLFRQLSDPPDVGASDEEIARRTVQFHYHDFANHDMVSHPILYSTGVGEEITQVDVFRISPEDACSLIPDTRGKPKLAGTTLNYFGAFFEEKFRTNDILWGRLDGAERIITALLPNEEDEPKRMELIEEAHYAILRDQKVFGEGTEASGSSPSGDSGDSSTSDALERFRRQYRSGYEEMRRLDPERTVRSAARASRVFGDMLERYEENQRRLPKGGVVWVTRLARLFWLSVEVAVPDSLASLVFRHGLKLLYIFEALMILLGTLLLYPAVQQFGFVAFVVTAAVHAGVLLLQDAMSREGSVVRRWWRVLKYGIGILVLVLAVLGLVLVLAALGLQFSRTIITFLVSPPGTTEGTVGTILRGIIMLTLVVVTLLVSRRRIPRRPSG